jgi:drug/metabolite transporter (DMT)-like permease
MRASRALPWALLVAASLCWAGNWVVSRGIRETMPPLALSFFRWLVVVVLLAPIALPALRGTWARLEPHWPILLLLSALGVPAFTICVYVGLQTTEAVNAVLLNASVPVITILCSWLIDRQGATWRQIVGMILSFAGILVIVSRGEPTHLLHL